MEKQEKKAKRNINLYTIYELFGYDLHFYLVVGIFFLLEVKNLSITEFLLLQTILSFFVAVFLLPAGVMTDKIGRKQCVILGNVCVVLFGLILILGTEFWAFAVANVFLGIGYALKSCAETPILLDSLILLKREEEYGRIEGKAYSLFAFTTCIFALISGYIYSLHNYLPVVLMIIFASIALLISMRFTNITLKEKTGKAISNELASIKESTKHIFVSKRLRSFLLFTFVFVGLLTVGSSFSKIALQETGMSVTIFGIIQACFWLFVGLGSRWQFKIQKLTKNKTLTVISLLYILSFILISALDLLDLTVSVVLIILLMFKQSVIDGIYGVSSQLYVTNFTTQNVRGKMLSILYFLQELGATLFLAIATLILDTTESTYLSYLILGIMFFVIFIFILSYMNKRFGLEPKEYTKEDLKYDEQTV